MKIIRIKKITFDEKGRKRFKKFLINNELTLKEYATKYGFSISLLSAMLEGTRFISEESAKKFEESGFKL